MLAQQTQSLPKALVIAGDGINCELETARALHLAGFSPQIVHLNDLIAQQVSLWDSSASNSSMPNQPTGLSFSLIALPGGFSFGDELGSGRVLALKIKHGLKWNLLEYAKRGGLVIGICNGFQALIQLGVFGNISITHNNHGKFINRWVALQAPPSPCVWTKSFFHKENASSIDLPIRHGEGRIVIPENLSKSTQIHVALRYAVDVNGSADQIAGLTDETGRILGLMPHPEAAVRWTQRPDWIESDSVTNSVSSKTGVGLEFFINAKQAWSELKI